ncbi:twin-arginine translocase TatA/TatE family subunit [Rhodococcus fascians]|jgi:sec-independent protein translocase protein TatA|uniref:Sec-independent protein translocase protein TatA n=1 Tax=Rhodococcoides fascians TaxID=1828 RepID=A0A143QKY7_RHOFA|nr:MULTISPECIES: twin-arginine translocase TatA/TatE family subunit [Rhodococcus]MDP9636128.1 sec-independent protein translocase protein TatA [Rhodococcus cercidiphylli]AMY23458.1 Sec-independent protein translocase protein TatA [Rhodococcus fascians]KJV03347.1 preprotein translocase subunit TatA [Rhodococcus sp. PML026]KMJ50513.1 Sec-independent protein secretion pathway component [Rhodococcus fascians]KQU32244.1 Sec-independent secretion protein [Rhodococcus sp. Leaf233]
MLHNLTGWHALVVLAIVLLVFGSTKLPSLAKGVGQSMRILKDEVREDKAKTSATPDDVSVPVPYRHAS